MAEAILVMTILGIIATIMISTLKPAEFKEKSMQIMAKKVMSELDVATTQIVLNHTIEEDLGNLIINNSALNNKVNYSENGYADELANLYRKYLTALRKQPIVNCDSAYWNGKDCSSFLLKDGASIQLISGWNVVVNSIFPGETNTTYSEAKIGHLKVDINDNDPPNVLGKDQFIYPLHKGGIDYNPEGVCCTSAEKAEGCPYPLCE
jgi:type II secretory pathway pseudopilin PulG